MSRGWESKDVESQQAALEERIRQRQQPQLTPEQMERNARRESLLLDRKRVERDLAAARHPRHQQQLREALHHLDERLADLPPDPVS